jgi:dTDP-glucose 4,6-dehydratase
MKLLVTGGAGFIGSNFTRLALQKNHSVIVLDLLTYAGHEATLSDLTTNPRFKFVKGDVADGKLVQNLFSSHGPDAVVHFAAETHVDRSIDDPSGFVKTNVLGTFELLEVARKYWEGLKEGSRDRFRFIHVSTDEVYGALGPEGLFHEEDTYAPNSPYAATKAGADHLARAYFKTYGLPVLITNCSNNYGPYQFPEKLIPLMMLNAIEGKELPVYGDGGQIRDWLYVEDHCEAVLTVLEKGKPGSKYLIGGRNEKNNLQVLEALLAAIEKIRPAGQNAVLKAKGFSRYEQLRKFVKDRPGHDRRYAIDPSKIESELDWKPLRTFEKGLSQTVEWYLTHLDWCAIVQKDRYHRERLGLAVQSNRGGKI